jgi:hypothetical protein
LDRAEKDGKNYGSRFFEFDPEIEIQPSEVKLKVFCRVVMRIICGQQNFADNQFWSFGVLRKRFLIYW